MYSPYICILYLLSDKIVIIVCDLGPSYNYMFIATMVTHTAMIYTRLGNHIESWPVSKSLAS